MLPHLMVQDHQLEMERLMDSSPYKEKYRRDMIEWSETLRDQDPGYFCRLAISEADCNVWLVCDARRKSDMEFFEHNFGNCLLTVRIEASKDVRMARGWIFQPEIDNSPSECGLDDHECNVIINNNSANEKDLISQLEVVANWVSKLSSK